MKKNPFFSNLKVTFWFNNLTNVYSGAKKFFILNFVCEGKNHLINQNAWQFKAVMLRYTAHSQLQNGWWKVK